MLDFLFNAVKSLYEEKEKRMGPGLIRHIEKMIMLQIIDTKWKDHLYAMDNLREGIGLRAYAQKDPLVEYQHEGYDMFMSMIDSIKDETVEFLFKVQGAREEDNIKGVFQSLPQQFIHDDVAPMLKTPGASRMIEDALQSEPSEPHKRTSPKVGRNDPCPCNSGKKYKKCCGK